LTQPAPEPGLKTISATIAATIASST